MKQVKRTYTVADLSVELVSDVHNGETLDTSVIIEGKTACVIAGADIQKFMDELCAIFEKYRI